jgi:hypothetical protein
MKSNLQTNKPKFSLPKTLFVAFILLVVVYIAETNALATQGYEISELQKNALQERELLTKKETEFARKSSIAYLKEQVNETKSPSVFRYIKPDGALVSR